MMLWLLLLMAQDGVVVASKNFTESRVLAEMMAQLIEARTDIPVTRRDNLGGVMVFEAAQNAEVDIYPEYTGTAWSVLLKRQERASDSLRTYLEVQAAFRDEFDLELLTPFGFENAYAVAVHEDIAQRLKLQRVSDLAPHAQDLKAGWSVEFLNREDGYPGLSAWYGFGFAQNRGMEHGLAYAAIEAGEIDVTDAYTTDGKLLRYPIRILTDDRGFFPPYDCAPVIRRETLERHPELRDVLGALAFRLSDETMTRLNAAVEEDGQPYAEVAHAFLVREGLLSDDGPAVVGRALGGADLGEFIQSRAPVTLRLATEHLVLTAIAVALAILIAVPLGVVMTRRPWLARPILGVTGVIQTVPSLALLAILIPIPGFGLSVRSAIMALFLYALLPIVRNTFAGIDGVDPDVREAAVGLGFTDRQVLWLVELPLAMATIMAGIRTAAVISIGVATLVAFIGAGGLGEPIVTGLQLNDARLILSGALPAALLALLVDWALGLVERRLA